MSHTNSTAKFLASFLALTAIAIALASSLYAQSSPSVSIRLSPSHSVPMDTAIAGTVTLNNLDVDSYSSVIFRADITTYGQGERRCNGDDTGRDIEIAVDDSREVFTSKIFDACPSYYDSYGSYTLDVSISRMDTSHPDGRVELASTRTQFMMSRYLTAGVPTATPPESGALAWMDPDPRNLDMVVHGEWHQFHFRVDITKYLNDHLGVLGYDSTQPDIFITLGEQIPRISVEQACRERRDDRVIHWRRASNQALVIAACKPGAATIELRHETEAGPPLYTYNFRTLSNEPTPPPPSPPSPPPTDTCVETLEADSTIQDSWSADCPSERKGGSYASYYTFSLAESSDVTIGIESAVDTYLFILEGEGRTGAVLYENDNIVSGNTNSQISETLAAGTYTIEVTTYDAGATGDFTLTVSALPTDAVVVDDNALLNRYDADGDGQINKNEVSAGIDDYFDGQLTLAEVSALIDLYFR